MSDQIDSLSLYDDLGVAMAYARALGIDELSMHGYGEAVLFGPDGRVKSRTPFVNLITDAGDAYYAAMAIALVTPAAPAQPTKLTGFQIGSGTTAAAKAGAGGAMVTLLAGQAFDATYPQVNNLGAGNGVEAVYRCTFAAGTGTGTVTESTVTNGTVSTASTVANTIARALYAASIPKNAGDSLVSTWRHLFKGV